jgi:hypothetical protein
MECGLSINVRGIGYLEGKRSTNLHKQKARAGRLFHNDSIISVCVFDETGTARLYLKKTENGVVREER